MKVNTILTVEFFKGTHGNCVKTKAWAFPAAVNGSPVSGKKRLIKVLKERLNRFYPGHNFILNFTEAK